MRANFTPPAEMLHRIRRQVSGFTPAQVVAPRAAAGLARTLALLAVGTVGAVATVPGSLQAAGGRVVNGLAHILYHRHADGIPHVTGGVLGVDLKDGSSQLVDLNEIWRIRQALAGNEPPGTTVIDIANDRLFVESRLSDVVAAVNKNVPLTKLTAPNGQAIYIATAKITRVSNALPWMHHPLSKAVIWTCDGTQQVLEPADAARRIIAAAQVAH